MTLRDINTYEWQIILCLRDARAAADKNASRSGTLDAGTADERSAVINWHKDRVSPNRLRWFAKILIKSGDDL